MRTRFLDFAVCPDCGGTRWSVTAERRSEDAGGGSEIEQGALRCEDCAANYAIENGIPRLLPRALRTETPPQNESVRAVWATSHGYDRQHLRQDARNETRDGAAPPQAHEVHLAIARQYFRECLGLSDEDIARLAGRTVLDAGCGGGRFMWVAAQSGASDVIGLDVSFGGLSNARGLLRDRPNVHFVQGDITHPPIRAGSIDVVYSIGVLHHLPVPEEGFRRMLERVAPGGEFWAWVYGLEGMSMTYRLSHLVWLRALTRTWSLEARYRLSRTIGTGFRFGYLLPMRALERILPPQLARRLPYRDRSGLTGADVTYDIFDRLQPPCTHYLRRGELTAWMDGFAGVRVESARGRGWIVRARRPA